MTVYLALRILGRNATVQKIIEPLSIRMFLEFPRQGPGRVTFRSSG